MRDVLARALSMDGYRWSSGAITYDIIDAGYTGTGGPKWRVYSHRRNLGLGAQYHIIYEGTDAECALLCERIQSGAR